MFFLYSFTFIHSLFTSSHRIRSMFCVKIHLSFANAYIPLHLLHDVLVAYLGPSCLKHFLFSWIEFKLFKQSFNRLINQSINWTINQSISQSVIHSLKQSINQSINQLTNQSQICVILSIFFNVIFSCFKGPYLIAVFILLWNGYLLIFYLLKLAAFSVIFISLIRR